VTNSQFERSQPDRTIGVLLDSLSIGALAREIIRRRGLVVAAALLGVVAGAAISLWGPPRSAAATSTQMSANAYQFASVIIPDVFPFSSNDAINRFTREVLSTESLRAAVEESRNVKIDIFTTIPLRLLDESQLQLQVNRLNIRNEPAADGDRVQLTLNGAHPRIGVEILGKLIGKAEAKAVANTILDRTAAAKLEENRLRFIVAIKLPQEKSLRKLEEELRAVRYEEKIKRDNQINRVSDALKIAEATGLTKPSPAITGVGAGLVGSLPRFDSRNAPLFLYGSDALAEQLKLLRDRKADDSDDPRIAQILRDIEVARTTRAGDTMRVRSIETNFEGEYGDNSYTESVQKLSALQQIGAAPPSFELMTTETPPNTQNYSDVRNLLVNILRGMAVALILICIAITAMTVARTLRVA